MKILSRSKDVKACKRAWRLCNARASVSSAACRPRPGTRLDSPGLAMSLVAALALPHLGLPKAPRRTPRPLQPATVRSWNVVEHVSLRWICSLFKIEGANLHRLLNPEIRSDLRWPYSIVICLSQVILKLATFPARPNSTSALLFGLQLVADGLQPKSPWQEGRHIQFIWSSHRWPTQHCFQMTSAKVITRQRAIWFVVQQIHTQHLCASGSWFLTSELQDQGLQLFMAPSWLFSLWVSIQDLG